MPVKDASVVGTWLRDLSDGYTSFNLDGSKDFSTKRVPGPFVVSEVKAKLAVTSIRRFRVRSSLGLSASAQTFKEEALPPFVCNEAEGEFAEIASN